jgi:hypothetical protein
MSKALARRIGASASALAAVLAMMPTAQAAPAGDEPATVDAELLGLEAALVRIEVVADVTIAHINHSTGDVVIHQGTYEVPQGSATGVLLTGDGVVATLYRELQEDLDAVTVPAANRLFVEQIGTHLAAGDTTTGPTHATDPALDEHLQHCYQRVKHCITVPRERYEVVLLSAEQQDPVSATLLNQPASPTDVALLRIGAGSLPTADLSPAQGPVDDAAVAGLTSAGTGGDPATPTWEPTRLPARLDGATLTADEDLPSALANGLNGGPVVDQGTGGVLALADFDPSTGTVSAVGADSIQAAMDAAGVTPARSGFDIAFTDGLMRFNEKEYAAAAQRLEAATDYFDSALAREHLELARSRAGAEDGGVGMPMSDDGGIAGWVWGLLALLVLAGLTAALLIVRRRRPGGSGDRPTPTSGTGHGPGDAQHPAGGPSAPTDGDAPTAGIASPRPPADAPGPPAEATPGPTPDPRPEPGGRPPTGGGRSSSGTRVAVPMPAPPAALVPPEGQRFRPDVDSMASTGPHSAGSSRAFCTRCGTALVGNDPYCGGCGSPVR